MNPVETNIHILKNLHANISIDPKELNSLNFRSEEFTTKHVGKHFLFSGCSVTIGSFLEEKDIWSKKLYTKISQFEKCSGYFNIGIGGTSVTDQVFNLFKYFRLYGKPDVLFYMLPDVFRFYSDEDGIVRQAMVEHKHVNLLTFLAQSHYSILEDYCKASGIKLYGCTWADFGDDKFIIDSSYMFNFNTFYRFNKKELDNHLFTFCHDNKGASNLLKAKDSDHWGIAYHDYWSSKLYEIYKKDNI